MLSSHRAGRRSAAATATSSLTHVGTCARCAPQWASSRTWLEFVRTHVCACRCVRPWKVCTSLRCDGNRLPNVFGNCARMCVRPRDINTRARRDGNDFPNIAGIRARVLSDVGKYTRVCAAMGIYSQQPIKLLVWWGLCKRLIQKGAARSGKYQQETRGARQSSKRGARSGKNRQETRGAPQSSKHEYVFV